MSAGKATPADASGLRVCLVDRGIDNLRRKTKRRIGWPRDAHCCRWAVSGSKWSTAHWCRRHRDAVTVVTVEINSVSPESWPCHRCAATHLARVDGHRCPTRAGSALSAPNLNGALVANESWPGRPQRRESVGGNPGRPESAGLTSSSAVVGAPKGPSAPPH